MARDYSAIVELIAPRLDFSALSAFSWRESRGRIHAEEKGQIVATASSIELSSGSRK
jgi:hypothetical protein